MNALVTNRLAPRRLALFGDFFIAALSILYAFVNLVLGILFHRSFAQPGVMRSIVAVFCFGGVQLFSIGVLGE